MGNKSSRPPLSTKKKSFQPPKASIPTVDRISDLPDSILCHILSFLPTKQAATTSVLSKRWKTVWLAVSILDFNSQNFKDFDSLCKFVYTTMSSIKVNNISIHSFSLQCDITTRFTQKYRQVEAGLEIIISNEIVRLSKLPPRIFSFKMLQILKLTNLDMGDFNQVDFPRLKTLHLNSVYFISLIYVVKFLFGCPTLEDLQSRLFVHNKDTIIENLRPLPNLVKVSMYFDGNLTPMSLVCNAKILHMVQVVELTWTNLLMFSNLTYLGLHFKAKHILGESKSMLGLFPHVPKLQYLKIQDDFGALSNGIDCWDVRYQASECLSLHLKICCISGYRGSKYEFGLAKYIMQHSKVLDTMIIKSACPSNLEKNKMLVNLSLCTRGSTTCKLSFE